MKEMRSILAAAAPMSLTACLAFPAFAATYDVTSESEVQTAVANPSKNTGDDRAVGLNMKMTWGTP